MGIKIAESLERIVQLTPEVNSILVVDKDGVPVVSAGSFTKQHTTKPSNSGLPSGGITGLM